MIRNTLRVGRHGTARVLYSGSSGRVALKAAAETTQDTSKTNAVHNTTVMGLIDKMFLSHTAAIWSKVEAFESGMADIDPDAPDSEPEPEPPQSARKGHKRVSYAHARLCTMCRTYTMLD